MIQQPELGRKIADHRKAKGLTQEELVEKCNLSVRTLQRIEAGDVTPRISTVKLIFESLELEFNNSLVIKSDKIFIIKQFEQFYRYFIDLFNLKTQTMKKVTILTVLLTAIIIIILNIANNIYGQKESDIKERKSQYENTSNRKNLSMRYSYFRSEESFNYNNYLVGRNTIFTVTGVKISSSLILINESTGEFKTSYATGILTKNKVEIFCSREFLDSIEYSSLSERVSYRKLHLMGDAKIIPGENQFIEAPEIILTTK